LATVRQLRDGVAASDEIDRSLAQVLLATGALQIQLGQAEVGTARVHEALDLRRALLGRGGAPAADSAAIATALVLLGDGCAHVDDVDGAMGRYREALAIDEELLAAAPQDPTRISDVGFGHQRVGMLHKRRTKFDAALAELRTAVGFLERAGRADPVGVERAGHTAQARLEIAALNSERGVPFAEQSAEFDDIEHRLRDLVRRFPRDSRFPRLLSTLLLFRADATDDPRRQLECLDEAVELGRREVDLQPLAPDPLEVLSARLRTRARTLLAQGDLTAAVRDADEAIMLNDRVRAVRPQRYYFVSGYVGSRSVRMMVARAAGDDECVHRLAKETVDYMDRELETVEPDSTLELYLLRELLEAQFAGAGGRDRLLVRLGRLRELRGELSAELVELEREARGRR
ncbi:MAG: hypothetical protein KDC98_04565, partial [Planctomycetes bacterium]|nr:hypothetical protein [Planctomycetota bacterium]